MKTIQPASNSWEKPKMRKETAAEMHSLELAQSSNRAAQSLDKTLERAQSGHCESQFRLACCYEFGEGVPLDFSKAISWYRLAAIQNHPLAIYRLAYFLYHGHGVQHDKEKALQLFQEIIPNLQAAADQNNAEAQESLAQCYLEGWGVNQDPSLAMIWYQRAIAGGNINAQYDLGAAYIDGTKISKNEIEGVALLRAAAEQSHVSAQYGLGCYYENAIGLIENKKLAAKWYQLAAKKGHADAQYKLGYCHLYGEGVCENKAEAVLWFLRAAQQGNKNAQYSLGHCYITGKGVRKDEAQGSLWYQRAAEPTPLTQDNEMLHSEKPIAKSARYELSSSIGTNPCTFLAVSSHKNTDTQPNSLDNLNYQLGATN